MFKYTEKKLANDIGRVAKSIDPSLRYTYLPDTREVELRSSDDETGGPCTIFLGNIFLKVSGLSKDERLATVEAFVREVLAPKQLSPDDLMNSLALRIRTDFEIDFRSRRIALMGQEAPPSIVFRRGELLVEIVSDRDESVSIARSDDLAEIGVTREEAIRMASAKIRRCTDEDQWKRLDASIWISRYQDDYDFARLVAALESAKFPFEGQPIVFAPSHSICLATDNTTAEVLSKMAELGNEAAASHRPFCQLLWTLDQSGEWRQWKPGQTSEARAVAQLQVARETVKRYEETKDYLEHSLGEDVFIATYQAIQNDDGLTCYSVYTLDLPSYLPVTDFVVIIDPERPGDEAVVGRVDWHEFEDCLGSVERVENMNPVWYRVIQPLDASRKDRIRKLARPLH